MSAVPRNQILLGDARRTIDELPSSSVDMVLTSPPYYGLRDYEHVGQLGREPSVAGWVDELTLVASGLKRVLKPAGTLWLNLGDSYSLHARQGAHRKSLLLGPERLAIELVRDGWLLRNKIAWVKPNPMPTSVADRLNTAWEYVYVFARQPQYYFDLDALRVPHRSQPRPARTARARAFETWRGPNAAAATGLDDLRAGGRVGHARGKNPGDVWTIANPGLRLAGEAHHAVFPLELARRAILAGCPPAGLVLDPFMGAGTAAVAADQLGRSWLGVELNPDYARLASRRLQQARAGPAT